MVNRGWAASTRSSWPDPAIPNWIIPRPGAQSRRTRFS